jgi:hypothetical protein
MANNNASDSEEDVRRGWGELEFENLCLALRRNDPTVTKVKDIFVTNYGPLLGDALQGNTHVSILQLDLTVGCIVSKKLDINLVHVLPLLNFVRQSQSLRKVRFEVWNKPEYLPYFLEAFLQNPFITDLEISVDETYEGPLEIERLIQSKQNLKVLRLPVMRGQHSFSEALEANQTIETLTLDFYSNTSHEVDLILRSISNHPRITRVELSGSGSCVDFNALNSYGIYFLLTSTTVLECLAIDLPIDDISFVEKVVEALGANRTLKELHIPIYFLQGEAIESLFVTYMQTRNGVGTGRIRTLGVSGLDGSASTRHGHWRAVARLLQGPHGSGLESIELDGLDAGGWGLWRDMAVNEQSRNLQSMVVAWENDYDRDREFVAMLRHLPNMLYLRKLQFYWRRRDDNDIWKFMWAIRQNGSLHFAERKERHRTATPSIWAGQPSRLLLAWGQRNRELPNLMKPRNDDDDDDDDVAARKVARESIASTSPPRTRRATNSALLPSLLLVARQTPRMAPNHKFSGLLAFGECIGR